jgi:hypothetical protein
MMIKSIIAIAVVSTVLLLVSSSFADDTIGIASVGTVKSNLLAQYADHACKACRNSCVSTRERENVGCCQSQGGKPAPSSCVGARNPNGYAQCLGGVSQREKACWQKCEPCGNTSNPNAQVRRPLPDWVLANASRAAPARIGQ